MSLTPSCLSDRIAEMSDALRTDRGTILAPGATTNSSDGPMPDWDNPITIASNVHCRLDPSRQRPVEQMNAGTTESREFHYIELPPGEDSLTKYRIVLTNRGNRVFEIRGLLIDNENERVVDVVEIGRTVA